jgi:ankyrin repeat protein
MMVRLPAAARALIEAGANPHARNDNGVTPLGMATYLSPDVTELFLKSGVEADQRTDSDGRTALWQASCLGNAGAVKLLLDAGADPRRQSANVSAFDCARHGKENARVKKDVLLDQDLYFIPDFDRVIALLSEALAKSK